MSRQKTLFYLTGFKFEIAAGIIWIHAVEKVKMLCQGKGENVMWKPKKLQCDILMIVEDMG